MIYYTLMRGRQLITHFAAANLFDAATTVVGVSSLDIRNRLFINEFFPLSASGVLITGLKCLTTTSVLFAYAQTKQGRVRWGGAMVEKTVQTIMPLIYLLSTWNLIQIAVEMIR